MLGDAEFHEFWDVYPRKVSKGVARRNWRTTLRRGVDPQDVIGAARRFADDCRARGTETKFIPHPSSWLSNERWADEPEQGTALPAAGPAPAKPSPALAPSLNVDEVLLATVIRLADPRQPITAAQAIVRYLQSMIPVLNDPWPIITRERATELAAMPYAEYLRTPEWDARRKIMYKVAGYRCRVCNRDGKLNAHHRTYERRGDELQSDLTVLCEDCHELFTKHGKLAAEPAA